MSSLRQQQIDNVASIIASKAESYQQSLSQMTKRVAEYSKLAEMPEWRHALEKIIDYGLWHEEIGMERVELIGHVNLVLTLMHSNPLTGKVRIPLDFWQSPFGTVVKAALQRCTPSPEALKDFVLDIPQAAEEAGVSRAAIYSWLEQGKLIPLWDNKGQLYIFTHELRIASRKDKGEALPAEDHLSRQ